jgi:hypothetical protein
MSASSAPAPAPAPEPAAVDPGCGQKKKFVKKSELLGQRREQRERRARAGVECLRDLRVAIVGGGLSGLATAIMLIQSGCRHVAVLERDEALSQRRQGYGLTILQVRFVLSVRVPPTSSLPPPPLRPTLAFSEAHPAQGCSALRRLGVLETVRALDTPSRAHYQFRSDGTIIGFFGTHFWTPAALAPPHIPLTVFGPCDGTGI